MKPEYREQLQRLFPLTAHGLTHREFVDRWHAVLLYFAERSPSDAIPGWPEMMDFAGALQALKAGMHLKRDVWTVDQFVFLQVGYPDGIVLNANTAQALGQEEGVVAAFRPYLMVCIPPGVQTRMHSVPRLDQPAFVPWSPSGEDVLAEDWRIRRRPDDKVEPPEDLEFGLPPGRTGGILREALRQQGQS